MKFLLFFLLLNLSAYGGNVEDQIKRMSWNGVEVVWLEDSRFPTYLLNIYFADGALSDADGYSGETNTMFQLLNSGTNHLNQKQIAEQLEFFGASYGASVTHEYSTYSISGLVKDIKPTMKKICHLFKEANFPERELEFEKKRYFDQLKNIISNKGALASRAFREVSLKGTPYALPVSGKASDIKKIKRERLLKKLTHFNNEVKKKIYITGPKSTLSIKEIIKNECNWNNKAKRERKVSYDAPKEKNVPEIVLVTIPQGNQAYIRIGRFLKKSEILKPELLSLSSKYLGGGFTSRLMSEVRKKRGLTYSIYSFAAGQKAYGRAGIFTFTKNETLKKVLDVIRGILREIKVKGITDKETRHAQGSLAGSYPFRFEKSAAFLTQIMMMDHEGRGYEAFENFPKRVMALNKDNIKNSINRIFGWGKQSIVVIGTKDLISQLRKLGKVEVRSYKEFL